MGTNDGYDTEAAGLRMRVSELEESLAQVKQELRLGEHRCHGLRMDALARFAQSVSDEIGEVVLSLSMQARELSECAGRQHEGGPSAGLERPLAQLQDTARRLGELGRRVGVIGGSRVAQVELVGLNDVVERFVALVRGALPKEIEVDFIPGHELSSVTADPGLLDQVLLNLCLNSRDALPRGGRITVETENVLVNGTYRESHPWAKPGRYVLLTVSDDGVGMAREIRDRAFEPFFTTKAPGAAVGLGLAAVYGIVQLHRGLVHLYTEAGRGTTVKVYLPAVERKAERVGPKLDGAVRGGTETILVAEDHDVVRHVVTKILRRAGYRVILARDGEECIRLYDEHRDHVALVLMDVVMPGLDGPAASARLKVLHPGVKILFASGSTERAISASTSSSPDQEIGPVVPKPYEPDGLLRTIRAMLDGDGEP